MKRLLVWLLVPAVLCSLCLAVLAARPIHANLIERAASQAKPTPPAPDAPIVVEDLQLSRPMPSDAAPAAPAAIVMSQNFEGAWPAAGWTLGDYSSNDGGEFLWGKRTCHPRAGSYGGWSVGGGAQGTALSCSALYPNNANTWAEYGPFNLSNATSASLTFHFWGRVEYEANCSYDRFFAGSSTDGVNFSGTRFCGDFTGGTAGNGYYQRTLDLSSRLGQSQVWIALAFLSDDSVNDIGVTVDDITLDVSGQATSTPTPTHTPTRTPTFTPTRTPTPTATRPAGPRLVHLPLIGRQATPTPTPTATVSSGAIWQQAGLNDRAVRVLSGAANGTLAGGERVNEGPGGVSHAAGCSTAWSSLGLADRSIFALARSANGTLYAGTYGQGILRSSNNGGSWSPINEGIPLQTGDKIYIYGIAAHPTNANIVLAGSLFSGGLRSTNGGDTWQRTAPTTVNDFLAVAFDPSNGTIAYGGSRGQGFFKSQDAGASFAASNSGLSNLDVWSIAVAPSNPATVYIGTSSGVFRSTNRGASWQPAGLADKKVRSLAVDPQQANVVYAGTEFESVWISNNGGANWQNASSGLQANLAIWSLRLDAACNRALAGSRSGVYQRSLSSGIPTPTPTPTTSAWTVIAAENFEGAFPKAGWQVADFNSSGGEYYWAKRACRIYAGTYSGWSVGAGAQGGGLACGANYPNEAFSWLIYGPFSLVGATDAELAFQSWFNTEVSYDRLFWGASLNGNNFYGVSVDGSSGSWVPQTFDLTDVYTLGNLLGQSQVWIAFVFSSDASVTYPEGAYVDEILLRKRTTAAYGASPGAVAAPCVSADGDPPPDTPLCTSLSLDGAGNQRSK